MRVRVRRFRRDVALHAIEADLSTRRHADVVAGAVDRRPDGVVRGAYAGFFAEPFAGFEGLFFAPAVLGFAGVGVDGGVEARGVGCVRVVGVGGGRGLLGGGRFGVAGAEVTFGFEGFGGEGVRGYGAYALVDGVAG